MCKFNSLSSRIFSIRPNRAVFVAENDKSAMEKELQPINEKVESLDVTDFDKIAADVDAKLNDYNGRKLRSLNESHDTERAAEKADLAAMDASTPEGKKEKAATEKTYEGNEARRERQYKALDSALKAAKEEVMIALRTKVEEAKAKKLENAKRFAESLVAELEPAAAEKRANAVHAEIPRILQAANLQYENTAMPVNLKMEGGKTRTETAHWSGENVKSAVATMLAAIYMEQGSDAATKKAGELIEAAKKRGRGSVNYFAMDEAFGDGGRGSFRYVLDNGICPPDKGANITGMVMGNMYTANELFKAGTDAEKYFSKYEAYLRKTVEDSPDTVQFLSPTEWAKKNAPEALIQTKNPGQLVADILSLIEVPAFSPAKERMEAKKAEVKLVLDMVAGADPGAKPEKLDGMLKNALMKMGFQEKDGKIVAPKDESIDARKIIAGREIYGDSNSRMDDAEKLQISALIYAAELAFGGERILVKKGDKEEPVDFVAWYKQEIGSLLKRNGDVGLKLRDARDEMKDKMDAARDKNLGQLDPNARAKMESDYYRAVGDILASNIPHPKNLLEESKKIEPDIRPETKPNEEPTAVAANETAAKDGAGKKEGSDAAPIVSGAPGVAKSAEETTKGEGKPVASAKESAQKVAETAAENTPGNRYAKLSEDQRHILAGPTVTILRETPDAVAKRLNENLAKVKVAEGEYLTPAGVRVEVAKKDGGIEAKITGITAEAYKKMESMPAESRIAIIDAETGRDILENGATKMAKAKRATPEAEAPSTTV
jgi:hypothetical protein